MTILQFARLWLERQGILDTDSVDDKQRGEDVLTLVTLMEAQLHDVSSLLLLFAMVTNIYRAYHDTSSEIWRTWWKTDEGKQFLESLRKAS